MPVQVSGVQLPLFDVFHPRLSVSLEGPSLVPSRGSHGICRPLPVVSGCWRLVSGPWKTGFSIAPSVVSFLGEQASR